MVFENINWFLRRIVKTSPNYRLLATAQTVEHTHTLRCGYFAGAHLILYKNNIISKSYLNGYTIIEHQLFVHPIFYDCEPVAKMLLCN